MPLTEDRDIVRLKIGDTDEDDPLLYDDEIDAFLTLHTVDSVVSVTAAAADAASAIAAKFARGYNFSTDGQSFNRSERVAHYQALAKELRVMGGGASVVVKSSIAAATDAALTLGE